MKKFKQFKNELGYPIQKKTFDQVWHRLVYDIEYGLREPLKPQLRNQLKNGIWDQIEKQAFKDVEIPDHE